MHRAATFSDDGKHRYALERIWDESKPLALFVMLNPGTADADKDDGTITRCIHIAEHNKFGGILVGNLYAFVQTSGFVDVLREAYPLDKGARFVSEGGGSRNDDALRELRSRARGTVVAWGDAGAEECVRERKDAVLALLGTSLFALGPPTERGEPRHPSRVPRHLAYLNLYRRR